MTVRTSQLVLASTLLLACVTDDSGGTPEPADVVDGSDDARTDADDSAPSEDPGIEPPTEVDPPDESPPPSGHDCDNPADAWLFCEDFEAGDGDFDSWFATSNFVEALGGDDRGRMRLDNAETHSGSWAIDYPASPDSEYRGADLIWYACEGEQRTNCPLRSYDRLYLRTWVRFAPDHRYVHHFLSIGGSQPDDFWYHGTAGCLPDGVLHMGTTLDFREDTHNTFFYTYFPGMQCDTRCERYADVTSICQGCADRGLPTCDEQPQCCWGNNFEPDPPVPLPVGEWVCLEMTMQANAVGEADGEMTYWVDGELGHHVAGLSFRESPTLALNRVRLQHYITSSDADAHSNRVWFDDVVVSTERVGCD